MKYALIFLPPWLLFLLVVSAGEWLLREPSPPEWVVDSSDANPERPPSPPRVALAPAPSAPGELTLRPPLVQDSRVPPHLVVPLRAVAFELNLCISQQLERDLGPIDVDVRFTPTSSGSFAPGTQVTTSWDDPGVADCIAEVFDEATWMPTSEVRSEPAEFVFHLPDDAMTGLLGLSYSPFK